MRREDACWIVDLALFVLGQQHEIVVMKRRLEAVGEADAVRMRASLRRAHDDADRARRDAQPCRSVPCTCLSATTWVPTE